uniref:Uncharacterized protein n=1 Tax=Arundo donax TaxID=35708 RepID=A0A0A9CSD1_ARUDO
MHVLFAVRLALFCATKEPNTVCLNCLALINISLTGKYSILLAHIL